jgi:hypothetical protein
MIVSLFISEIFLPINVLFIPKSVFNGVVSWGVKNDHKLFVAYELMA